MAHTFPVRRGAVDFLIFVALFIAVAVLYRTSLRKPRVYSPPRPPNALSRLRDAWTSSVAPLLYVLLLPLFVLWRLRVALGAAILAGLFAYFFGLPDWLAGILMIAAAVFSFFFIRLS